MQRVNAAVAGLWRKIEVQKLTYFKTAIYDTDQISGGVEAPLQLSDCALHIAAR